MKYYDMEYEVQHIDVRASNLELGYEAQLKATAILTWYDDNAEEWCQESIGNVTEPEEALKLISELIALDDPAVTYGYVNAQNMKNVVVTMIWIRR